MYILINIGPACILNLGFRPYRVLSVKLRQVTNFDEMIFFSIFCSSFMWLGSYKENKIEKLVSNK